MSTQSVPLCTNFRYSFVAEYIIIIIIIINNFEGSARQKKCFLEKIFKKNLKLSF